MAQHLTRLWGKSWLPQVPVRRGTVLLKVQELA